MPFTVSVLQTRLSLKYGHLIRTRFPRLLSQIPEVAPVGSWTGLELLLLEKKLQCWETGRQKTHPCFEKTPPEQSR